MERVNWGILGDAKIARDHVIPGMQKSQHCNVLGLASRDGERAKRTAQSLGIERSYGSYEDMLADPDIEAVYIPLPNHLHVPWAAKTAEAGKHVLCEKPIALTANEAATLLEVRDRTGMMIQEAFMVHSNPQWLRARELVRSGEIGDVRAIQWCFSYFNDDPNNVRNMADIGGGGIYDIGCYPITLSRYIFGEEPTRVVAMIERDPTFKTDRLASALMDFPSGQANFVVSTQAAPFQRVQMLGTKGRIEVRIPCNAPIDRPLQVFLDKDGALGDTSVEEISIDQVDQYGMQGDVFSEAVRGVRDQGTPLEDAVANMRVIDAVFRSAEVNGWVDV